MNLDLAASPALEKVKVVKIVFVYAVDDLFWYL
jgi:hypothetical protein